MHQPHHCWETATQCSYNMQTMAISRYWYSTIAYHVSLSPHLLASHWKKSPNAPLITIHCSREFPVVYLRTMSCTLPIMYTAQGQYLITLNLNPIKVLVLCYWEIPVVQVIVAPRTQDTLLYFDGCFQVLPEEKPPFSKILLSAILTWIWHQPTSQSSI